MKKLILLIALLPISLFSQHSINGTFSPASAYTYAFLYRATPTGSDYINRAKIEEDGSFNIPLDTTSTAGIYKIVYALPPEENNFDLIYNGKESISLRFSNSEGLEFTESNENKLWASYTNSIELVNRTISNFYTQESIDKKAYKDIINTLKDTQIAFEDAAKGSMVLTFIKANSPYIPKAYEDLTTYSNNLKRTFLNHVDFNNPLLQSSDFLVDRVLAYIFGMSANTSNDTYKNDVNHLMSRIGEGNAAIKTILLEMIWRRFTQQDNPEVANFIADTYLLKLSHETNYQELTQELLAYKANTIGMKAQDFDLAFTKDGQTMTTTLHKLNIAQQYLIVFWSSTCGHCLDELPKVNAMMASKPLTKVIAIGLEDDAENWQKTIANYPNFIHVLGLGKWDNPIANAYDVGATPTYLLLDKDKIIISKPVDVEALEKVLK